MNPLLIVFGGLIVWQLLAKVRGLQTLDVSFKRIQSVKFNGANPVVKVLLNCYNPSNQKYQIQNFGGSLYYSDKYIGYGSVIPFYISAKELIEVEINFEVNALAAGTTIVNAIAAGFNNSNLIFHGAAMIDGLQVPINTKFLL